MPDAYQSIGAKAWLGSANRSFALDQAVGSVGLQPSHTARAFTALGNAATRRAVVDRQCNLDFDTLYWRPGDDDLFTWLESTDEVGFLVELANGAAFYVAGPRSSFTVTAPTDDLLQVVGTLENGDEGYIALVGGRVDSFPALTAGDFGADAVAYANWDWDGEQLYAVTALDEITHAASATVPVVTAQLSNMVEDDNTTALPDVTRTIFTGVDRADTEEGAGLQVAELTDEALGVAVGQTRRGTFTPVINAGLTALKGRSYVMQEMGVATRG